MDIPPLYIVSGGEGTSAEQVILTALAQFKSNDVPIVIRPQVRSSAEIAEIIDHAAASHGAIVHTLVDGRLRQALVEGAREKNVVAIDLIGHLLAQIATMLGEEPLGQPGLYRQLRQSYFERIEAIEFTVSHDDGRNPHEMHQAEIVLAGVSRAGKTPLSIFLSTQGWKVANIPIIKGVEPPQELFEVDARRVVGLTIEPGQLIAHRRWRQQRLGVHLPGSSYIEAGTISEDIVAAQLLFRRAGFAVLNITDRPIEESAEAVVNLVSQRLRHPPSAA
jgi:regulator of PEP synthase PpsR (kinase-PPPase family)